MKTIRIQSTSRCCFITTVVLCCGALLALPTLGRDPESNPASLLHPKDGFGRAIVKTIEAASGGFESIKGKLTKSDGDFDTFECLIPMPGSVDSDIAKPKPEGDSFVSFDFVEGATDESSPQAAYEDLAKRLRELLIGWKVKDQPQHITLWKGTRFEKGKFSVRLAWYKSKTHGTQSVVVTVFQPSAD